MKKRIAVLLTVHNRREKTLKSLNNLYQQEIKDIYEMSVFLTDDGSTDGTSDSIKNQFPDVHIIEGDGNLFWNRGMYAAWEEAEKKDFDFYLWLNDDTFIYKGAIVKLLFMSETNGDRSLVVGTTCSSIDKTKATYGGRDQNYNLIDPQKDNMNTCVTCNGNIVLIPKYVYNILGKNDRFYHHSLGDFDYGLRATSKKIPIVIVQDYLGECDSHENIAKWKNPQIPFKERYKNFISPSGANPKEFFYFRRKHYGLLSAILTYISNYVHLFCPFLWSIDN